MSRASRLSVLPSLLLLAALLLPVAHAAEGAAQRIDLAGTTYVHQWSKNGQNEYLPAGQTLETWEDMVTLVVNENARDGETLAGLANAVLANYQQSGVIVRTNSLPMTAERPAEHLIVAMLQGNGVAEAVFARLVLHDGAGFVVVRSKRARGEGDAAVDTLARWLSSDGEATETALMAWNGLPSLAAVQALPQTP